MTQKIDLDSVTAHPLSWPVNWPRTSQWDRHPSAFREKSLAVALRETFAQLGRMGVPDYHVIVSSNVALKRDGLPYAGQKQPADPGVAVYFRLRQKPHVLACDRWNKVEHNLWAIARHIDALRAQDRWGVGSIEQAFAGYEALPAHSSAEPWHVVLGVAPTASEAEIRAAYAARLKAAHPDHGGSAEALARVMAAYEASKR
jgi:hypothetical protein